jgi:hypothetical protein
MFPGTNSVTSLLVSHMFTKADDTNYCMEGLILAKGPRTKILTCELAATLSLHGGRDIGKRPPNEDPKADYRKKMVDILYFYDI